MEGLQSAAQVAVQPQHWKKVNIREEDVRCVYLLYSNITQEVHRKEILRRECFIEVTYESTFDISTKRSLYIIYTLHLFKLTKYFTKHDV